MLLLILEHKCKAAYIRVMNSDQQDEADIKLILAYMLRKVDATACGATSIDRQMC